MSNGSMWGMQLARAQERAERRYPKQPERARKMADSELAIYNGPYKLEPLTVTQRIAVIFGADHIVDLSDLPLTANAWQQFKRGLQFFLTGK